MAWDLLDETVKAKEAVPGALRWTSLGEVRGGDGGAVPFPAEC